MLVLSPKAFVSTNLQTVLKDTRPLIYSGSQINEVYRNPVLSSFPGQNSYLTFLRKAILGFTFFTHCTKASVSDDAGLIEMLTLNIDYFKSKPLNIPQITVLLDNGYHPEHLTKELEKIDP